MHTGVVTEFFFERGLGTIRGDGGAEFPFHCTAIADGTRDIAVGTRVAYDLHAGHHGRIEASGIGPI